jgi:hypothetical protein
LADLIFPCLRPASAEQVSAVGESTTLAEQRREIGRVAVFLVSAVFDTVTLLFSITVMFELKHMTESENTGL